MLYCKSTIKALLFVYAAIKGFKSFEYLFLVAVFRYPAAAS